MKAREFDLEETVPLWLREQMRAARALTDRRSGKRLNFFITSDMFPSVSITGSRCSLQCKHCAGKLLERLIPCSTPDTLISTGITLESEGAKGILITGGCNTQGKVPVTSMSEAIKNLKENTDLILIAHTGFISPEEAYLLKESGVDGIGFDVVGDTDTARRVYGLDVSEHDYISSLQALSRADIILFPHVCVGLDSGKLRGEFHALEMIGDCRPSTVVITGLMPVAGTRFSDIKPDPLDFATVITAAVKMFPRIPITLGCARSSGKDRELIDHLAVESGVENIAIPTQYAVNYGVKHGYAIEYYGTCCGLPPSRETRISPPGVGS